MYKRQGWDCKRQCGLGESDALVEEERQKFERAMVPTPVGRLGGERITSIAAGGYHSAAVSASGALLTWGRASEGQLGLGAAGANTRVAAPALVRFEAGTRVTAVAAAAEHTACITAAGALFTFGTDSTSNGLLGHGSAAPQFAPRQVQSLASRSCVAVDLSLIHI